MALDRSPANRIRRLSVPELAGHRRSVRGFPDAQNDVLHLGRLALGWNARRARDHDGLETRSGRNGRNAGIRFRPPWFDWRGCQLDKITADLRNLDDRQLATFRQRDVFGRLAALHPDHFSIFNSLRLVPANRFWSVVLTVWSLLFLGLF